MPEIEINLCSVSGSCTGSDAEAEEKCQYSKKAEFLNGVRYCILRYMSGECLSPDAREAARMGDVR